MIVLATDAPLSSRNLERLARRAILGLARTGSFLSNGSGDFVIAFSTRNPVPHEPAARTTTVEELHNDAMSPLFLAAVEAVEEAVYNSLTRATDVTGHLGHRGEAIPIAALRELLAEAPRPRRSPHTRPGHDVCSSRSPEDHTMTKSTIDPNLADEAVTNRQQSAKHGARSTAQKEEGTRYGGRPAPDAAPAEGAFGNEGNDDHRAERGIGRPGGDARQGKG